MANLQPIVGWALAALAIVLGFIYFRVNRPRKTLDWFERANSPLVTRHKVGNLKDLDLFYNGRPISDPRVVFVRVTNTGKGVIKSDDYARNGVPTFRFEQCRILGVELAEEEPKGVSAPLEPEISSDGHSVWFKPESVNSGNWFDLQLVVDGPEEWPVFTARFNDETRPPRRRVEDSGYYRAQRNLLTLCVLTGLLVAILVWAVQGEFDENPWPVRIAVGGGVLLGLVGIYQFGRDVLTRRRGGSIR